ncbi:MAG: DUF551 domain-containing protein [Clostridiales bacterium]|nr:DUF551 domain-containing protein [Clostridiales bacterium]
MSRTVRTKNDHQQAVVKMMGQLSQRHSAWEVWNDYIVMMAEAIANALGGPYRDDRETDYLNRIGRYSKDEQMLFCKMSAELVDAFEDDPCQDFLGELFMALNLGNNWKGQFFTPYSVCSMMAEITFGDEVPRRIEETGTYLCALRPVLGNVDIVMLSWAPWEDCRGWYTVDKRGNVKPYTTLPVTHWMPLPEPPEAERSGKNA